MTLELYLCLLHNQSNNLKLMGWRWRSIRITYHRIWFARASLTVCKEASIVALPSIIENLLAKRIENNILISILRTCWLHYTIFICCKLIVAPKRIIESKRSIIPCVRIEDCCCRTILESVCMSNIVLVLTIATQHLLPFSLSLKGLTRTATLTLLIWIGRKIN